MLILIPFLACLIGVIVYALSSNGKVMEIARAAIWCGLFWTIAEVVHGTVRLLPS